MCVCGCVCVCLCACARACIYIYIYIYIYRERERERERESKNHMDKEIQRQKKRFLNNVGIVPIPDVWLTSSMDCPIRGHYFWIFIWFVSPRTGWGQPEVIESQLASYIPIFTTAIWRWWPVPWTLIGCFIKWGALNGENGNAVKFPFDRKVVVMSRWPAHRGGWGGRLRGFTYFSQTNGAETSNWLTLPGSGTSEEIPGRHQNMAISRLP